MISHWDDARTWRGERGHIAGTWRSLTGRSSDAVGVKRIEIDAGMWSTPLHLEGAEEEIFYVLGGSGVSLQSEGEETLAYEVGPGDCIVHLPLENAHTLRAGDDGLDVLAFGQRVLAPGITWLPRAEAAWLGETWGRVGAWAVTLLLGLVSLLAAVLVALALAQPPGPPPEGGPTDGPPPREGRPGALRGGAGGRMDGPG